MALKLYWPAFLALQIFAGLLAAGYYASGAVRDVAHWLLEWKSAGGLLFVVAANIFSGAVLPEMLKAWLRPPGRPAPTWRDWLHLSGLMAILGLAVNEFYRAQGEWFDGFGVATAVALKILVDQLVFALLFALPLVVVWFAWQENSYRWGRTRAALTPSVFLQRLIPLYLPNLLFWVPALIALYSLPTELQFLLYLFLNSASCLLMIFIAREMSGAAAARSAQARAGVSSNGTTGASRQRDSKS
jgi:hypothetical protein